MKEDKVQKLFADHKQPIENNGFSERLLIHLAGLPKKEPVIGRSCLIVIAFSVLGLMVFVLLGGYGVLVNGISSVSSLWEGKDAWTPEVYVPVIFLICSMIALVWHALREA